MTPQDQIKIEQRTALYRFQDEEGFMATMRACVRPQITTDPLKLLGFLKRSVQLELKREFCHGMAMARYHELMRPVYILARAHDYIELVLDKKL